MNTRLVFVMAVALLSVSSCRDQGQPTESPVTPHETPHAYSTPGQVEAVFVDTVSLPQALSFVRDLGLTPVDFTHFQDDTVHWGIIGVPVGKEMMWVDSLRTYKSFIKEAGWLTVVFQS
ncbi:MAG: hypothetical protein WBW16_07490 [Bacteroidota bacterium]